MGPLVYTSGSDGGLDALLVDRHASLGPLVYTSGSDIFAARPRLRHVLLQWGRWFTPAEAWKRGRVYQVKRRFNGAAGLHQRKHPRPRLALYSP